jgi:hypothetical protein
MVALSCVIKDVPTPDAAAAILTVMAMASATIPSAPDLQFIAKISPNYLYGEIFDRCL